MFYHAYNNYLKLAYPMDEVCSSLRGDKNIAINDVLGNYATTLVDTLDTIAIMGDTDRFREGVDLVTRHLRNFNINARVQVFETNIRIVGGLLSSHHYARQLSSQSNGSWVYNDTLLDLAYDLGNRLLLAFSTPTGIPWPRINMRHGVLATERQVTCSAGAGTLMMEFGVLGHLTNDTRFMVAAKRAMHAVWQRRGPANLVGNEINILTGKWTEAATSIGAGVDSFYEYMFKAHVMFDDAVRYETFLEAYDGIVHHILDQNMELLYLNVDMFDHTLYTSWVDSLSAYISGLQAQVGDIRRAIRSHMMYWKIWQRCHAMPERWDFSQQKPAIAYYILRPEFIESTYYLYQATRDPFYLQVGETVLLDLNKYTRTRCGFAQIRDIHTMEKEPRMESFFLSETLKYLYLLFTPDHPLNRDDKVMFTTEGHPLWPPPVKSSKRRSVKHQPPQSAAHEQFAHETWSLQRRQCPRYTPTPLTAIATLPVVQLADYIVGRTSALDNAVCTAQYEAKATPGTSRSAQEERKLAQQQRQRARELALQQIDARLEADAKQSRQQASQQHSDGNADSAAATDTDAFASLADYLFKLLAQHTQPAASDWGPVDLGDTPI
ncbi:hypothetical protein RI367_003784 [Sorochytrium milnesiophthora]